MCTLRPLMISHCGKTARDAGMPACVKNASAGVAAVSAVSNTIHDVKQPRLYHA
jgi:hypothetical protein